MSGVVGFEERRTRVVAMIRWQQKTMAAKLDAAIAASLRELGYDR
jgi:hypothetical protein